MLTRLLSRIYRTAGDPDFSKLRRQIKGPVYWAIEAGCHDGTDTLTLLSNFNLEKIYAFEPDPSARAIALDNLAQHLNNKVLLSPAGLSSTSGYAKIVSDSQIGNGSSQISLGVDEHLFSFEIELVRLDDSGITEKHGGILWLDVEGHAVPALTGGTQTLHAIDLAKIEIQMHPMGNLRPADAFEVIRICKRAGLFPVRLPIHPGFFGDIYFIRKIYCSPFLLITGMLNHLFFIILHRWVYPKLNKPSH